jgi:geranylgeranyl reductase family protein
LAHRHERWNALKEGTLQESVRPKFEIAIVGAGPAGAWAAYSLSRRGASVLLIDPSHPREKPCGGGVTGRALEFVASAIDIDRLPAVVVRRARFSTSSSTREATVPLDANALVVASRREFDELLVGAARRAGAHVLDARVGDVEFDGRLWNIETTAGPHRTRLLIGADGANSLIRRRLVGQFRRDQLSIATGFLAHGVSSQEILVELIAEPPGYIWSFPRPTHLAIGVCAQADTANVSKLRQGVAEWISRRRLAEGARLEPYSWPIPSLSARDFEAAKPAGNGWCLVGDAAGLVDPLTREGIYFALQSAEFAADAIAEDCPDGPRRYIDRVGDEIAVELAQAARLKATFFRPQFTSLLIEALRHSEAIRATMHDLVAGRQEYVSLKWRLLKTFEFRLAAKLLLNGGTILKPFFGSRRALLDGRELEAGHGSTWIT